MSRSSTSNVRVAFGGITGGKPRGPRNTIGMPLFVCSGQYRK